MWPWLLAILQRCSHLSGAAPHPSAPPCSFSYFIFFPVQGSDVIASGSPEGAESCPRMSKGCMMRCQKTNGSGEMAISPSLNLTMCFLRFPSHRGRRCLFLAVGEPVPGPTSSPPKDSRDVCPALCSPRDCSEWRPGSAGCRSGGSKLLLCLPAGKRCSSLRCSAPDPTGWLLLLQHLDLEGLRSQTGGN